MRDALCTQLHATVFDLDPINIDRQRRVVRLTLGVLSTGGMPITTSAVYGPS